MSAIQPNRSLGAFGMPSISSTKPSITGTGNILSANSPAMDSFSGNNMFGNSLSTPLAMDTAGGSGSLADFMPQFLQIFTTILTMMMSFLTQGAGQGPGQGYGGETETPGKETPGNGYNQPPGNTEKPGGYTGGTDKPGTEKPGGNPEKPPGNGKTMAIDGGGPNETKLNNNTDKPMTIAVLKNDAKEPVMVTVPPNETVTLSLPKGWAGRMNKVNADGSKPQATLGEVTFDGAGGQMFYDASVIDGYNGPMTMRPTNAKSTTNNSPLVAGSEKDIISGAPAGMKIQTTAGETILDGVAPVGDFATKKENQAYYLSALGLGSAYTYPKDDVASTRTAMDNSITLDFF